jgi:hypothetical protein
VSGACAEVQFPDSGPVLWSPGSRNISRKHCDFSTNIAKNARATLAHAQRSSFLFMEQCCGPLSVEMIPGNHCDIITYLAKRTRAQSGAYAEVQFPDYGTALWSPGSRNCSRKVLRFQQLSCQEIESSVWHMRRGADS